MASWKLQDAKNRFSELVARALTIGPQVVSRHGKNTVVVVDFETFAQLKAKKKRGLVAFFRESPLCDVELTRDTDSSERDIVL